MGMRKQLVPDWPILDTIEAVSEHSVIVSVDWKWKSRT